MLRARFQFAFLTLIIGLVLFRETQQLPLRELDESFADFLARNTQRSNPLPALTTVEINSESLKEHAWPWTPLDFALFFQAANAFGPEVIATTESLDWESKTLSEANRAKLPQYKNLLREHLLRAPKVLLGAQLGFPEDAQVIPPLQEVPLLRNLRGPLRQIPEFTSIQAQAEEEFRLSSSSGFTNLPDERRSFHSAPLLWRYRGQLVPSFVLQAILLWERLTPEEVTGEIGKSLHLGDRIQIPINEAGEMQIDFGAPRQRCGFDELVLSSAQRDAKTPTVVPIDKLKARFLLLTRTDPPAQTLRLSGGRKAAPGELIAAAIATIQNRSFLRPAPFWSHWLLIGLGTLLGFLAPAFKSRSIFLSAATALLFYVGAALFLFTASLVWLPIVLPFGLLLFICFYRLFSPARSPQLAPPTPAPHGCCPEKIDL